jgi:hypothetical protein
VTWIQQWFCKHVWAKISFGIGYYDEEHWYECTKCGKQEEIEEC